MRDIEKTEKLYTENQKSFEDAFQILCGFRLSEVLLKADSNTKYIAHSSSKLEKIEEKARKIKKSRF